MVLLATLALCALLTAGLVYRYDLYEHEPIPLLGVAVALGAGAMFLAGRVEAALLHRAPGLGPLGIASVAAASEELLKLLVVLMVALLARREFDDPMDGVVYGSMAGLGAALEESVSYSGLTVAAGPGLPAGELVRLWAHVVLGGIAGFSLGFFRSQPRRAALGTGALLAIAVTLHLCWDAIVLSIPDGFPPSPVQSLAGAVLMVVSLSLYGRLVTLASARSRRLFDPNSPRRLWGWPFDRLVLPERRHPSPDAPTGSRDTVP